MKRVIGIAPALLTVLIGVLAVPSAAVAASPPESAPSYSCVYSLQPLSTVGISKELTVIPVKEGCYGTMAEANAMALDVSPASSFFDGDDWGHINWSGENIVWTSQHTCYEGYVLNLPSMPSGWNDRVRSAQRASACEHWVHFENASYGGAQIDCHPGNNCLTMGAMAAQTSSERWHN